MYIVVHYRNTQIFEVNDKFNFLTVCTEAGSEEQKAQERIKQELLNVLNAHFGADCWYDVIRKSDGRIMLEN